MAFSTNEMSGGDGLSSEINVTPLIDILLVLLIIFMVIVPVAPLGLDAALPSADTGTTTAEVADRPVFVQVEQSGEVVFYLVDGARVDRSGVASRLQALLRQRATRQVLLKADARLDFGVVSAVMDESRAAGADSVALITPGEWAR